MGTYRTTPEQTSGFPKGIPYILGNELAERFSFYGMKSILTIYMTHHLVNSMGEPEYLNEERAKEIYHNFTAAAYFFPLLGGLLADRFLGKYMTIITLSLGYLVGHAALAMGDTGTGRGILEPIQWLFVGLIFIAVGAGGIKSCVSAHLGDQFGSRNKHLVSKVFSWWYFSINVGSAVSTFLTPRLLDDENYGPAWAFGLPGVLMALALLTFWFGRNKYAHIPPAGKGYLTEVLSYDGLRALLNLAPIFLIFVPAFWALFDQTGSAWTLQATRMDLMFLGIEWLPAQIQLANPILILILIPVFAYGVYPALGRVFEMTPLRKIGLGMFTTAGAFAITGWIETRIQAGDTVNIGWQLLAYVVLTAGEVMVSITSLEFAYTQAPKKMKSFIMGVYFFGVSLGNLFTAQVNSLMDAADGEEPALVLDGADYYWFFMTVMLGASIVYVVFAMFYKGRTFLQDEVDEAVEAGLAEGDPAA